MAEAMAEGKAEAESAGVARVVVAPSAASDIARCRCMLARRGRAFGSDRVAKCAYPRCTYPVPHRAASACPARAPISIGGDDAARRGKTK